jgi:hypothetical protein
VQLFGDFEQPLELCGLPFSTYSLQISCCFGKNDDIEEGRWPASHFSQSSPIDAGNVERKR